jgi:isoquinoline 1-oxidoreductase alpha subunit
MAKLNVNGKAVSVDVEPEMPLLWVLRDELGLTGTKYGCGIAMCGACTVHVDGQPTRSCVLPVSAVEGKNITTIEALSNDGAHPVQKAWVQLQVPQCGYCQSGMIMAVAALLDQNKNPSDEDISIAITNICRCGTYARVREAIHIAAKSA